MKELGRLERYDKELSKMTKAKNLPPEWATSKQSGVKGFGKIAKVECDSMSRDV
jgi:hypothetical protein